MNFLNLFKNNESEEDKVIKNYSMDTLKEHKVTLEKYLRNIKKSINRPYTETYKNTIINHVKDIVTNTTQIYTELQIKNLDDTEEEFLDNLLDSIQEIKEDILTFLRTVDIEPEDSETTNKVSGDQNNKTGQKDKVKLSNIHTKTIELKMDNKELLKLGSQQINKAYSGDPLTLNSFIDSIRLLEVFATTTDQKNFLVRFLKTRIEGPAREFLSNNDTTIQSIIDTLTANIKPDSSKVIEGRMLSLRLSNSTSDDFSKRAEELSDSLRRSLIVEGISTSKATEMAIEKTVELCRKNTNSDLVKSVLESTKFDSPKEVIAKL